MCSLNDCLLKRTVISKNLIKEDGQITAPVVHIFLYLIGKQKLKKLSKRKKYLRSHLELSFRSLEKNICHNCRCLHRLPIEQSEQPFQGISVHHKTVKIHVFLRMYYYLVILFLSSAIITSK